MYQRFDYFQALHSRTHVLLSNQVESSAHHTAPLQQFLCWPAYVAYLVVLTHRRSVKGLTLSSLTAAVLAERLSVDTDNVRGPMQIAPIAAPRLQRMKIETSGRLRAIKPNSYVFVDLIQSIGGRVTSCDKSENPRPPQRINTFRTAYVCPF